MINRNKRTVPFLVSLASVLTVLMLTACTAEGDGTPGPSPDGLVPLRITAATADVSMQQTTRAVNSAWDAADQIGVFCTNKGTTTVYTNQAATPTECRNLAYTFNGGTNYETSGSDYRAFTGPTVYLPANGAGIDVYAYYPYRSGDIDLEAIPVNVSTQFEGSLSDPTNLKPKLKEIDFMAAAKVENRKFDDSEAQLLFSHKLVKLVFNLTAAAEGTLTANDIEKNPKLKVFINDFTTATYNLNTSALTSTGSKANIYACPIVTTVGAVSTWSSFEAIVLPTTGPHTVNIKVSDDNATGTFSFTTDVDFDAGNAYEFNVTVDGREVKLNSVTIKDWQVAPDVKTGDKGIEFRPS